MVAHMVMRMIACMACGRASGDANDRVHGECLNALRSGPLRVCRQWVFRSSGRTHYELGVCAVLWDSWHVWNVSLCGIDEKCRTILRISGVCCTIVQACGAVDACWMLLR